MKICKNDYTYFHGVEPTYHYFRSSIYNKIFDSTYNRTVNDNLF